MKRREFRIYKADFEDTLNSVKSSSKVNNQMLLKFYSFCQLQEIEDIQQEV